MPTLKRAKTRRGGRQQYTRVYRPHGTKFAEAKECELERAMDKAWYNFVKEFGRMPIQEQTFAEIVGVTGAWDVTVLEITNEEVR